MGQPLIEKSQGIRHQAVIEYTHARMHAWTTNCRAVVHPWVFERVFDRMPFLTPVSYGLGKKPGIWAFSAVVKFQSVLCNTL